MITTSNKKLVHDPINNCWYDPENRYNTHSVVKDFCDNCHEKFSDLIQKEIERRFYLLKYYPEELL